MSFLDDIGEFATGVTNTVSQGAERYFDAWVDNEVQETKSAAPEQNRTTVIPAQEPTGEPVSSSTPTYGLNTQTLLIGAVVGLGLTTLLMAFKD